MKLEEDAEFLWIAYDGLKAGLPPPWVACSAAGYGADGQDRQVFFFNEATGESTWDDPRDEEYRRLFQTAKKAKNTPCVVGTLTGRLLDSALEVSVNGMNGDPLAVLEVEDPFETVKTVARRLIKQLGHIERIELVLLDGTRISEKHAKTPIIEILGIDFHAPGAFR